MALQAINEIKKAELQAENMITEANKAAKELILKANSEAEEQYNTIVNEENIVYIKGRLSIQEEENAKIIAQEIKDINDKTPFVENQKKVYNKQVNNIEESLFLKIEDINDKENLQKIENILKLYPGRDEVFLCTTVPKKKYKWNGNVTISNVLIENLKQILNETCIKIVSQ